jgi:membrane protein
MKISQVEWGTVGKAALKEYGKDDIAGLAAEMAYWIVFSLFPFFAFLAFLTGIIGQIIGVDDLFNQISNTALQPLDPATRETLQGPLGTLLSTGGGALSFGAIISAVLALNSASAAMSTTMKACNRAYGVEETRNAIIKKLMALGLTFVFVLLLVGGVLFLSLGGKLADLLTFGGAGRVILLIVRIVIAAIGMSLALAILYWKGPNIKQQFVWISPGSILATVTLFVLTGLFGLYVRLLGESSYAKTYGALAGVILFLFFLRLASTVILLGAEFNAEATKRYDPETIRDKITDPNKMIPGEQPAPHPQAAREAGVSQGQVAAANQEAAAKASVSGVPTATKTGLAAANGSAGADGGDGFSDYPDPAVEERLRRLREQPAPMAEVQARRQQEELSTRERAERAKTPLAAFAVSAATAVGGVVLGALRRRANQ